MLSSNPKVQPVVKWLGYGQPQIFEIEQSDRDKYEFRISEIIIKRVTLLVCKGSNYFKN